MTFQGPDHIQASFFNQAKRKIAPGEECHSCETVCARLPVTLLYTKQYFPPFPNLCFVCAPSHVRLYVMTTDALS